MLITLRQLLDHAAENNYGVPAFNINNMEQGLSHNECSKKMQFTSNNSSKQGCEIICW